MGLFLMFSRLSHASVRSTWWGVKHHIKDEKSMVSNGQPHAGMLMGDITDHENLVVDEVLHTPSNAAQ